MSFQTPISKCTINIDGLGSVQGLEYANGVRQFFGIPYATLAKRWTRAQLKTKWTTKTHDGTTYGPMCPNPAFGSGEDEGPGILLPVPTGAHHPVWPKTDEKNALVVNITMPPNTGSALPVFAYVHGGSLMFGASQLPGFDCVNLVTHGMSIGKPIVAATFNYRVGLGGFLAGTVVQNELREDGHSGSGNFGFTDQQLAFEWINKYIPSFGGDPQNVTAVGESAGGISISHQLLASNRPMFHRAVCMSGLTAAIPAWTISEHDTVFSAACSFFDIDPAAPDALDALRAIPEQTLANATSDINGCPIASGIPCFDGWFHKEDPRIPHVPPSWLKAYMLGDTYHEGVIFHPALVEEDYGLIRRTLMEHIKDDTLVDDILNLYDIHHDTLQPLLIQRMEHMAGDAVFKIPNYLTTLLATRLEQQGSLFPYHFDNRSKLKNMLNGTAYHAYELLYLYQNLNNELDEGEREMAAAFATAWISFAHGDAPWETGSRRWMVWGPDNKYTVKSEAEDEDARSYTRFDKIVAMGNEQDVWIKWLRAIDVLVNKRMCIGTFSKS